MSHTFTRPSLYYTPPADEQCAYCPVRANDPDRNRIPCEPAAPTPEGEAWYLRDYARRLEGLAGYRPHPTEMMRAEIIIARARLHQYLDEHGLAGSEYDDR